MEENPLQRPIPEDEKTSFRNRLLPVLASSSTLIRANLIPVLQKILQYDFPEKWPDFLDITLRLLGTNEVDQVFAGLQCVLAICRTYRFKAGENREEFNRIVAICFDTILAIATRLVDEESLQAAEMLRTIIKSYKHAVFVGQPG